MGAEGVGALNPCEIKQDNKPGYTRLISKQNAWHPLKTSSFMIRAGDFGPEKDMKRQNTLCIVTFSYCIYGTKASPQSQSGSF